MTIEGKLQEVISNPENYGKIVVAMPNRDDITPEYSSIFVVFIRSLVRSLPQIIRQQDVNFIYGDVNLFSNSAYKTDFIKKCESEIDGSIKFCALDWF